MRWLVAAISECTSIRSKIDAVSGAPPQSMGARGDVTGVWSRSRR